VPLPFLARQLLVRTGLAAHTTEAKALTGGQPQFVKYLSDRTLAAPVEELLDPATFPDADGPDVMNLNLPAPRFDSPIGGWRFTADRQGNPNPWGLSALRQIVAERKGVDADSQVFVTHGATAAYAAVLDAFVNPGDRVVMFDPTSALFRLGALSRRAKVRAVPTWMEDGRTRFVFDHLATAMRGAMLLVLSLPNNPTGGTLTGEAVEHVAWLANRHDVLVYADETFDRFRYDDSPPPGLATQAGMSERLISAGSMTAGYALGSLRVGWLTGHPQLVRPCALNALLSAPFVPTACQQAAARAVQAEEDLFAPTLAEFKSKRQYTVDRLKKMGLDAAAPGGGFFCWVPVAQLGVSGRDFAERLLREQRVLVGPGSAFGPSGKEYVRVSFAVEDGRLREGLTRLGRFVETLKGTPVVEEATVSVSDEVAVPVPEAVEERMPAFSRV
jgi:aspartate/methionine/tyrosine aminotransferase